jgi:hypothetical protein
MFEIIGEPTQALAEMVRVLRSGGRVVLNGPDIDASMIDATDRDLTRKIIHYIADHEYNGWFGRQLRGYCHEFGLTDIHVFPEMSVVSNADYPMWRDFLLSGCVEGAAARGVISATEAAHWFEDLEARYRTGRFFAAASSIEIVARKP